MGLLQPGSPGQACLPSSLAKRAASQRRHSLTAHFTSKEPSLLATALLSCGLDLKDQ